MKKSENIGNKLISPLFMLFLIILIQITVVNLKVPKFIFPSPVDVCKVFLKEWKILLEHTGVTVFEALSGFLLSIVLGIIAGGLLEYFKILKKLFYPILLISQMVPLIAIAPLILIWFGFGIMPKILIVVAVCVFPCILSFLDGLSNIDAEYINLLKTMKASELQIFLKLKLPASIQSLISGLKISAVYSITGAVIGEWLGAEKGLGIHMTRSISSFKTDALFADIIIIIICSFLVFKLVETTEKLLMPWKKQEKFL